MKILFLDTHPQIGGPFPKYFPGIIRSFRSLGCDVISRPWGQKQSDETLMTKIIRGSCDLTAIGGVLYRERFDVLFVNTAHDMRSFVRDIPLLYTARLLGQQKIVIFFHGSQAEKLLDHRYWLLRFFSKWVVNLSSAIFLLSTEEETAWKKFWPNIRAFVVRIPIPSEPFVSEGDSNIFPITYNMPVVLFVGRMIIEKGVLDLVEAMPRILSVVKCHLLLVGDGKDRNKVLDQVHDLGIEESVSILGYLRGAKLQQAYRQATVFALPTYFPEGFPVVVLEAMNAGLPIITTRTRGAADWLKEPTNALFVPIQDSQVLAQRIVELLSNKSLMASMRIANRELIKSFEPVGVANEWYDALVKIVEFK